MTRSEIPPAAENEIAAIVSNKERLIAEIRRIKNLRGPVTDKIERIRQLVDQYFNITSNEERLNANLPLA